MSAVSAFCHSDCERTPFHYLPGMDPARLGVARPYVRRPSVRLRASNCDVYDAGAPSAVLNPFSLSSAQLLLIAVPPFLIGIPFLPPLPSPLSESRWGFLLPSFSPGEKFLRDCFFRRACALPPLLCQGKEGAGAGPISSFMRAPSN